MSIGEFVSQTWECLNTDRGKMTQFCLFFAVLSKFYFNSINSHGPDGVIAIIIRHLAASDLIIYKGLI